MPELPEVEASRKFVEEHCLGLPIVRATVADDSKVLCDVSARALEDALKGKTIVKAHRKGKHLWFELDQRPWPAFQFGMTGAILIKDFKGIQYKRSAAYNETEWPSKYSKVLVELENGVEMAFTDKRRFARVRLLQDPPTESPISELGPDAYLEYPPEDTFVQALQLRKGSIKGILLDQSFLAGIGNWIADEVLYQARIHPEIQASCMTSEGCKSLYEAIKEVVQWSVKVNADHEKFPEGWLFHQRWNRKPGVLEGNKIQFITVGGRTSAYVPALQKIMGLPILSGSKKRTSRNETTSLLAGQMTDEKISPASPREGIAFRKCRELNTHDAEEDLPEEGLAKVDPAALIDSATEEIVRAGARVNTTSRRRRMTDTADAEGSVPENEKKTPKVNSRAKRKQLKANAGPSGTNTAEGEQDVTVVASRRSSSRLQNLKKTQDLPGRWC